MISYHAINHLAIAATQQLSDLEHVSCMFLQAIKTLQHELSAYDTRATHKKNWEPNSTHDHAMVKLTSGDDKTPTSCSGQFTYHTLQRQAALPEEELAFADLPAETHQCSGAPDAGGGCDLASGIFYPLFRAVKLNLKTRDQPHTASWQEENTMSRPRAGESLQTSGFENCMKKPLTGYDQRCRQWSSVLVDDSMEDITNRIYTSAFATFPSIVLSSGCNTRNDSAKTVVIEDLVSIPRSNALTDYVESREDESVLNLSAVLGALLYNAALSFHLRWLEVGQSSVLRKALMFYQATRTVLQTSFPLLLTTARSTERCHEEDEMSSSSNPQQSNAAANACQVLLAVSNNLCAIYYELVDPDQVTMLRQEMRLVLARERMHLSSDIFREDPEALHFFLLNAFDREDMTFARAA